MYRNRNKLSNASRDAKATDRLSQRKVLNTINEDTTFKPSVIMKYQLVNSLPI